MSLSLQTYDKFNPPPPPVYTAKSVHAQAFETKTVKSVNNPSKPYLSGLPIQFLTIPEDAKRTTNITSEIFINFSENPFTYLNFSNINDDELSPEFNVFLSNVPIGTVFVINGPVQWDTNPGNLILLDTDSNGGTLPNATLEVNERGTITIPTVYVNIMVVRDSTGLVARSMN